MKLSNIKIKNYRLLVNTELEIDEKTTLIVGRNNTGKTSLFECFQKVLNDSPYGPSFTFNDYPLRKRKHLYEKFASYMSGSLSFKELLEEVEPISVELTVDYSLDGLDDSLGALSPFIIDVESDLEVAIIRSEYKLKSDEKTIRSCLESIKKVNENCPSEDEIRGALKQNFNKLFELKVYAVNPKNPKEIQLKKQSELRGLFPYNIIQAERRLGEDGSKDSSLKNLISDFFDVNEEELNSSISTQVKELRNIVSQANSDLQKQIDEILNDLLKKSVGFGYPNKEELQLQVTTQLSIGDQLKNQTQLSYADGKNHEQLPSNHNGLGYKNLIKIAFLLAAFAKKLNKHEDSCIPLLFLEEPESHMHPQMQQTVAAYLETYLNQNTERGVQTLITSHSSQIANTMDFSKIRYAKRTNDSVAYKSLNTFVNENHDNYLFIKKYLTLTKCDLFFADKVILIEGGSERLLLPDMITQCDKSGNYHSQTNELRHQYYSLIEVGGAYAHKFIPFVEFLEIPCLIITDLDPVADDKACLVSEGVTTSNATIKWWYRRLHGNPESTETIPLKDIMKMSSTDKTWDKCHIEFQTEENGLCGRSLEEAIRNVNREFYKLDKDIPEEKLKFTGKSKTDFAIKLVYECEDYVIPSYIKDGLKWLNDQLILE